MTPPRYYCHDNTRKNTSRYRNLANRKTHQHPISCCVCVSNSNVSCPHSKILHASRRDDGTCKPITQLPRICTRPQCPKDAMLISACEPLVRLTRKSARVGPAHTAENSPRIRHSKTPEPRRLLPRHAKTAIVDLNVLDMLPSGYRLRPRHVPHIRRPRVLPNKRHTVRPADFKNIDRNIKKGVAEQNLLNVSRRQSRTAGHLLLGAKRWRTFAVKLACRGKTRARYTCKDAKAKARPEQAMNSPAHPLLHQIMVRP